MTPQLIDSRSRAEWLAIVVVTLSCGILRIWPPGRLGLVHFDEGIYAIAATWSLNPGGLWTLDPSLIPYAPPGFPILVGILYAFLGPTDQAAIAVSCLAGTATIPIVAWLARRAFGPGAGLASAWLVGLSGPHIAFSRMALTDVSFLLAWLAGIVVGVRFLERPTLVRGIMMGLAVGLAQQFKYNGWLVGGAVAVAAMVGLFQTENRARSHVARVFGWGACGILAAALVVLPWFLFVERHGGYSALLEHQRGYLVGPKGWLPAFRLQQAQAVALSGGHWFAVAAWTLAAFSAWGVRLGRGESPGPGLVDRAIAICLTATGGLLLTLVPDAAWWLALGASPWLIGSRRVVVRVIGVWWILVSVITPFYHPYARLWLPVEAADWLVAGGALANGRNAVRPYLRFVRGKVIASDPTLARFGLAWAWAIGVGVVCSIDLEALEMAPKPLPGLLAPSDDLRLEIARVGRKLSPDLGGLRFYGRPPIRFYLGGRVPLLGQAEVGTIFRPAGSRTWALIDFAQVSPRVLPPGVEDWESVGFFWSDLNNPTLLDLEPDSSIGVFIFGRVPSAPVLLYKPRTERDR